MNEDETRVKIPEQIKSAMASAAEAWVRVQIQLRCLQHAGWEVVVGGIGHDLALVNPSTGERRTIEIKSRQAIPGLTKHRQAEAFGQDLYARQTEADFLVFVWFDRGLVFVKPVSEMRLRFVRGVPKRKFSFAARDDPHLNAWDRLFEERR
jgi:hypothetical protein